jgi:hypothetical protein
MGRPPKDPGSLKEYRIVVAVSPSELAELVARAELAGLPLIVYVRLAATGRPLPKPVPLTNRQAWTELSRLASNLAQLGHAINAGIPVGLSPALLREAYALTRSLRLALLGKNAPEVP